jgi:diacylglycerol kinase (ATP)
MKERRTLSVRRWWQSFGFAVRGLQLLLRTQPNARLHLLATGAVLALSAFSLRSPRDWALVLLATGFVWVAESFNTALEFLTDLVSPEWRPLAGQVKDLAAAAVLLAAATALAVGILIFGTALGVLK